MKKSVNGKSFDEIFAERGREVKIEEMVKGKVYLFDKEGKYPWDWIAKFGGLRNIKKYPDAEVGTYNLLCSDGSSFFVNDKIDEGGFRREDTNAYFEATPDQIDLLNLYINS
jgi:hypothetical protein